jgi:predicted esterase
MKCILSFSRNYQNRPDRNSALVPLLLIVFGLFSNGHSLFAQQVSKVSPAGTKFLIYTPPGYNPAATTVYPLLVVLHGGSVIGDDITKLTTTPHQIPSRLIKLNQWSPTLPFIVVTPLLKRDPSVPNPNDQEWPAAYVNEVVDHVKATYKLDVNRYYFTGISLGGAGVWDYCAAYPTKVTAMIPISGKTRLEKACIVKNTPIWAFHGESDALVKAKFSIDMVNAINACQPVGKFKPRLNLLFSKAHEGWNEVYNGTNEHRIYEWLLKFKKNSTANKLPYVNAGVDHKILLRSQSLHLTGDYFDSDGTIASAKWTQTAGAALTLANTTTQFLKLTNLKAGTFEFQLLVTDNKGGKSSDKVTLQIVAAASAPNVTSLVLINGKTNKDIGPLTEGQVINKSTLGITEINIRAVAGTGTGSVRLRINNDQNTRSVNSPGPYLITKQISPPEWQIKNGEYLICATPYPQTSTRGTPGITQCFKITVTATGRAADVTVWQEGELLRSNYTEGNQWVLNDNDIEGASDESYRPTVPGVYHVKIRRNDMAVVSNKIIIDKTGLLGNAGKVSVYPNPLPSSSSLHIEGLKDGVTQYMIVNGNGLEVQRGELNGDSSIEITNRLNKGIYTLVLRNSKKHDTVNFMVE